MKEVAQIEAIQWLGWPGKSILIILHLIAAR